MGAGQRPVGIGNAIGTNKGFQIKDAGTARFWNINTTTSSDGVSHTLTWGATNTTTFQLVGNAKLQANASGRGYLVAFDPNNLVMAVPFDKYAYRLRELSGWSYAILAKQGAQNPAKLLDYADLSEGDCASWVRR